jgi:hypothetical protein
VSWFGERKEDGRRAEWVELQLSEELVAVAASGAAVAEDCGMLKRPLHCGHVTWLERHGGLRYWGGIQWEKQMEHWD